MKSRTAIIAATAGVVVIGLTAAGLWLAARSTGGEETAGGGADDAAVESTAPGDRPVIQDRNQPGPGAITLSGGVFDAAGTPVKGAEITAEFELGPGVDSRAPAALPRDAGAGDAGIATGFSLNPAVIATSNDDGAFALIGLVEGRYRLRVEGPDIFTSEVRFFDVPADGLRLIVARKVSVRGRVVGADGAPAAGVAVSVTGESIGRTLTAVTDPNGAFGFDDLQEGVFQVWAASGDRAAPARRVSRLGEGPFDAVELTLGPAAIITGRVIERGTSRGIAAAVSLTATSSEEPARFVRSAPDGNFRFEGIPGGRWSAAAFAPGYVATEAIDFEAGGAFSPTVTLTRGGVIEGRVVDGDGVAIAGAIVSARGTDARGRAVVVSEQSQLQQFQRATGTGGLVDDGTGARPGGSSPVAGGGSPVAGGDSPVAGGRFIPRGELGVLRGPIPYPPPKGAASLRIARALDGALRGDRASVIDLAVHPDVASSFVTDADGIFRIAGLAFGRFRIAARHPEYADATSKSIAVSPGKSATGVTVVMVPGVMLTGTVTNSRGELIVGATLIADPIVRSRKRPARARNPFDLSAQRDVGDRETRLQVVTGTDGRYRLGPIARDVALRVTAVRHGDVDRAIKLGKLGNALVERIENFVLPVADATLAGRVRDAVGFPVRGAEIQIESKERGARSKRATSDEHGRFAIEELAPGSYALIVSHPGFPTIKRKGATDAVVEISLAFGGGIGGLVRDKHTGAGIPGARVQATGPGKVTADTAAGDDGAIQLVPLVPGAWTLVVTAPGYVPHSEKLAVKAGREPGQITVRDRVIELARGATIAGTVRDHNGVRVRGATIAVGELRAKTNENGEFRLRDVPTGDTVIAAERDGVKGQITVSLNPGDEIVTLDIRLGEPPN